MYNRRLQRTEAARDSDSDQVPNQEYTTMFLVTLFYQVIAYIGMALTSIREGTVSILNTLAQE